MMIQNRYRLSFTTGNLYYLEAIKATTRYFAEKDWIAVRRGILNNNDFNSRTMASCKRITHELLSRLQTLSEEQLQILVQGSRQEQNHILWLAVCKRYQIIKEFATEVTREKVYRFDFNLTQLDFDIFLNAKSEWHDEIAHLTPRTRTELRRVLFQIMREADIISNSQQILPALPSPRVARAIKSDDIDYCAVFPVFETDFLRQATI